jgi:sec-independent protein translocase protein TatA
MGDALAPWHIIILVVVLVLLFGAKRLPGAAQSLGRSMHIFKNSVQGGYDPNLDQDSAANPPGQFLSNPMPSAFPPVAPPAAGPAQDTTQQQLLDLQRQVADLQRQSASSGNAQSAETQTPQPF